MNKESKKSNTHNIRDFFDIEPYECQQLMFDNLIKAFISGDNAIIESPTGTGKCRATLSACASYLNSIQCNIALKNERKSIEKLLKLKDNLIINSSNNIDINSENKIEIEQKIKRLEAFAYNIDTILKNSDETIKIIESINKLNIKDYNIILENIIKLIIKKVQEKSTNLKYSNTIIYAVRTHSQMDEVYDELQKIPKFFKFAMLKSRDSYCINENIRNQATNSNMLNALCKSSNSDCEAHSCYKTNKSYINYDKGLKEYKENNICPYYNERDKIKNANLIVCTYNYLLSSTYSELLRKYVINPIIIFDEAHNILSVCEELSNYELKATEIHICISELDKFRSKLKENI